MKPTLPLALCAALGVAPAAAQSVDQVVRLSVLPGWDTSEGTRMAGLRIDLAPGWKTYWRAPGDAGIPPQFDVSGENITGLSLHWPRPEVFDQNGMRSIGYSRSVTLPMELAVPNGAAPTRISGTVELGVCEEICIPVRLEIDAVLPPAGARNGAIVAALLDAPQTADEAGLGRATCRIEPTADGVALTALIDAPRDYDVVIEAGNPDIWVSEPDISRVGGTITATVDLIHLGGGGFALDRSDLRFTLLAADHAIDMRGCAAD